MQGLKTVLRSSRAYQALAPAWWALQEPGTWRLCLYSATSRVLGPLLTQRCDSTEMRQGDAPAVSDAEIDRKVRGAPAGSIPHVIFQTWKSRSQMPGHFAHWSATLKRHNPDFLHVLWDDGDNRGFVQRHFPWFLPVYDSYPREIFRADIVRPMFLFRFGGVYADMDTECVRPLARCLGGDEPTAILGRMGHRSGFAHSVPNAMMASPPGHVFWLLMLAMAAERHAAARADGSLAQRTPEDLTGPCLLKDAADFYLSHSPDEVWRKVVSTLPVDLDRKTVVEKRLRILDPGVWFPVNWNNSLHRHFRQQMRNRRVPRPTVARWLFPSAYLTTYWTHSW